MNITKNIYIFDEKSFEKIFENEHIKTVAMYLHGT